MIQALIEQYDYQFKFVIDQLADCQEVEAYLESFPDIDRRRVMLMPQGTSAEELARKAAWLQPLCQARQLHYCPRRHIEWFGLRRGT